MHRTRTLKVDVVTFDKSRSRNVNAYVKLELELRALVDATAVVKIEHNTAFFKLNGTQRAEASRILKQISEETNAR